MTLVVMLLGPVSPADQDIRTAAKEWSRSEEAKWVGFVGERIFLNPVTGHLRRAEDGNFGAQRGARARPSLSQQGREW